MITLIEQLHQRKAELAARNIDPWLTRLESVRGQIDNKGCEQISTQLLLDILEVPQHERAKNYRRLARLMASSRVDCAKNDWSNTRRVFRSSKRIFS